jgi:RNA methyltransferase, TrmH family
MISIQKLSTLPKKTRLRKIITIIQDYEIQIAAEAVPKEGDREYLAAIFTLLADEPKLPGWMHEKLKNYINLTRQSSIRDRDGIRRMCNDIRYGLQQFFQIEPADWDFQDFATGRLEQGKRKIMPFQVFLEDLRSPFNVGSIFRTAESFGAERILMTPAVPTPGNKRVQRTAMGCADIIPWEQKEISSFAGMPGVFVLETGGTSIDAFQFPAEGIVIIGSEELGVSPEAIEIANRSAGRVTIPTYGAKGSLNVSVAFGILMHRWYNSVNSSADVQFQAD